VSATLAVVKGLVTLGDDSDRQRFAASGGLSFKGARIGALECRGGTIDNPRGFALDGFASVVETHVHIDRLRATGQVRFEGAVVQRDFRCSGMHCAGWGGVAFNASRLRAADLDLIDIAVEGSLILERAQVRGTLWCSDIRYESPEMKLARPDGSSTGMTVSGEVDRAGNSSLRGVLMNLDHASVGVLRDDVSAWPLPGTLSVDGLVYEAIDRRAPVDADARLHWLDRQPTERFRPQPYDQLVRVLREMGDDGGARTIAMAKRDALRKHGTLGWASRVWSRILSLSIGYGYLPRRALVALMALALVGTAVFETAHRYGAMIPVAKDSGVVNSLKCTHEYPCLQVLVYSLDVLLPVGDLEQEKHWRPNASTPLGAGVRWYIWLHMVVGFVLTTLLVAALSGIVKRE
jgi:hypothetical protein